MEIKEIPIKQLKEYENNPRYNDDAVPAVAKSIKEFGFKVPIVVDSDNVIIAGHTRLKAAKILKLKTVPCIVADDLSEEQIRAFRLADNKTSELADWNFELLNIELDSIADIDMGDFGFMIEDVDFGGGDAPEDFKDYDENLETKNKCPRCSFEW